MEPNRKPVVFYTKKYIEKEQAEKGNEQASASSDSIQKKERTAVPRPVPKTDNPVQGEVKQLKIRFPEEFKAEFAGNDGSAIVSLTVAITDPDFPYDLERVHVQVAIPSGYPNVTPTFIVTSMEIPDDVRTRIDKRLNGPAIRGVPKGEPSVRPVLRYLETHLEEIIANRPTIKFISADAITISPVISEKAKALNLKSDDLAGQLQNINICEMPMRETRFEPGHFIKLSPPSTGLPYTLRIVTSPDGNSWSLAMCASLSLTVQCSKCSEITGITDIRAESERISGCVKCKRAISVSFYPCYLTGGQDGLAAWLSVGHGRPHDYLPSQWQIECPDCNVGTPGSSVRINKLGQGELVRWSCRSCGKTVTIELDSIYFEDLQVSREATKKRVSKEKLVIAIGQPLPDNGTCQHYRKSFRWYRFPCCGRAFPCDLCHSSAFPKTSSDFHEMERANRWMCGWCAREYSIATLAKGCECGELGDKGRTAHWEGGRGMRDQGSMSRKDVKKYRGLTKTQSKKSM